MCLWSSLKIKRREKQKRNIDRNEMHLTENRKRFKVKERKNAKQKKKMRNRKKKIHLIRLKLLWYCRFTSYQHLCCNCVFERCRSARFARFVFTHFDSFILFNKITKQMSASSSLNSIRRFGGLHNRCHTHSQRMRRWHSVRFHWELNKLWLFSMAIDLLPNLT